MATTLRLGNTTSDNYSAEALEFSVKMSKCTSVARPKTWKKYALRSDETGPDAMVVDEGFYAPLKLRTEYYVDRNAACRQRYGGRCRRSRHQKEDDDVMLLDGISEDQKQKKIDTFEKIEKEELVRGFKYGTTYAPCPDGQFPRLATHKGIDICGFFPQANVGCILTSSFRLIDNKLQFRVANCPWAKYSMFGPIHRLLSNK